MLLDYSLIMSHFLLFATFLIGVLVTAVLVVSATPPTIDNVSINQSTFNPTENSITEIFINFNATDTNGTAHLNNTECKCQLSFGTPWTTTYENAQNTSCANQTIDTDTMQYSCTIKMQYWYANGTYAANVTIADIQTSFAHNATSTLTYAQLIASSIDTTLVDFGTIVQADYDTTKTDLNSPLTVTNTGNKNLTLKITGAHLTAKSATLNTGNFSVNNASASAGALTLTTTQQTIPGTLVPIEDATPGGNTEDIWFFFAVPNPFEAGAFSAVWTLTEE